MVGICRLCQQSNEILDSHIYPKFVMRWMKKTGPGYFRFLKRPNVREQDGPTARLLCSHCEQRFCANESYFASHIFHPTIETSRFAFAYDARLMQFGVSLLWRVLQQHLSEATQANDPYLSEIHGAEKEWRLFLLGEQPLSRFAHVHLFVTDLSDESPPGAPHFNKYCTRAIDGGIITDMQIRFVYAKIARFLYVGMLSPYNESKWCGTRLGEGSGRLSSPQAIDELEFGKFLHQRARGIHEKVEAELSEHQRQVIQTHFLDNSAKILKSDFGAAFLTDEANESRYASLKRKMGRNEPCPCGSGFKFKKCHGGNF